MTNRTLPAAAFMSFLATAALGAQSAPQTTVRAMVLAHVTTVDLRLDPSLLRAIVADPSLPARVRDNTEGAVARVVKIEAELTGQPGGDTIPIALAISVEAATPPTDTTHDLIVAAFVGHLEQSFDTLFYGPPRLRLQQRAEALTKELAEALQQAAELRLRTSAAEAGLADVLARRRLLGDQLAETRLAAEVEDRTLQHLRALLETQAAQRERLQHERGEGDAALAALGRQLAALQARLPTTPPVHEPDDLRQLRERAAEMAGEVQAATQRRDGANERLSFCLDQIARTMEQVLATQVAAQRANARLGPLQDEHKAVDERSRTALAECLAAQASIAAERLQFEIAARRGLLSEIHGKLARFEAPRCHVMKM
jgi:hypothetical protein